MDKHDEKARTNYTMIAKNTAANLFGYTPVPDDPPVDHERFREYTEIIEEALREASPQWQPIDVYDKTGEQEMWLSDGYHIRIGFWRITAGIWIDLARAEGGILTQELNFVPKYCQALPSPPEGSQ